MYYFVGTTNPEFCDFLFKNHLSSILLQIACAFFIIMHGYTHDMAKVSCII